MPSRRCARCGRIEPPWGDDESLPNPQRMGVGDPADAPLADLAAVFGHSWASINGEVVCPDCQDPAERTHVMARRAVSLIEQAIKSRDEAEAEPSPVEAEVVKFAMKVREALSSVEESE